MKNLWRKFKYWLSFAKPLTPEQFFVLLRDVRDRKLKEMEDEIEPGAWSESSP